MPSSVAKVHGHFKEMYRLHLQGERTSQACYHLLVDKACLLPASCSHLLDLIFEPGDNMFF